MTKPVRIGFLGRLSKQKNAAMLLEAFGLAFPFGEVKATLAIAGVGPEEENLRRRSAELGLTDRVEWLGQQTAEVLNRFDLFALPSSYEGMPYVLLEALRARLPIVATTVGGVQSVIRDGEHGFIVKTGDCAAFASALRRLACDLSLRRRMSIAAAERVSEFSLSRMVHETIDVYRSAVPENYPDPQRVTAQRLHDVR